MPEIYSYRMQTYKNLCARIALHYGELGILRNREGGKIYVVDVNKTPFGPPVGIPREEAKAANIIDFIFLAMTDYFPLQA
jgi:hypothetical protein